MAKQATVNVGTATNGGADAMWNLIATLVLAGWTKDHDSDGTTYSAGGTQVTGPAAGANGLNNARAWFVMTDPAGGRSFCFQRATAGTDYQWRIKYSHAAGFVGGAPAATVTPSATDEAIISGGGTDAAPTFGTVWSSTPGSYRAHCIAQDAAVGGVYAFYAFGSPNAGGSPSGGIGCEALALGSYPSADQDPCIILGGVGNPFGILANSYRGWYKKNLAGEAFVDFGIATLQQQVSAAGVGVLFASGGTALVGVNPYDGNDNAIPAMWGRIGSGSSPGWKGIAASVRSKGVVRDYPDTTDLASDAYVYAGVLLIPWPNGVTPL